jgi:hypothetical protein
VYQYSPENGSGNPTSMVAEWKVYQYSYKKKGMIGKMYGYSP